MKDTKKKHRILTRAGFKHVSGWVLKHDAPKVEKLIDKAADRVAQVIKETEK